MVAAAGIGLAAATAVCGADGPRAARDGRGAVVELAGPARRIVCLLESALSTLYMLGADEALVGVPAEALRGEAGRRYAALDPRMKRRELSAPGNWDFVNVESVLALRPDLVVMWASQREATAALEARGLRVYGVEIRNLADVHDTARHLGALAGREARARELLAWVDGEVAALREAVRRSPARPPRAYFMWAQSPLDTAGRRSAAHELLELAGASNACPAESEHVVARMEDVLAWRPEVIVMWPAAFTPEDLLRRPEWRAVPAVRERRVHALPSPFWCDLWTLKYAHAARVVAAACHPRAVPVAEIETACRRTMRALYGPRAEAWFP